MTTDPPTFSAEVTREDNLWVVVITGPLPDGAVGATDTPRFADVPTETRDLIADLTDLDEDEFRVEWRYLVNGRDVTAELVGYQSAEHDFRDTSARLQTARDGAREQVLSTLARGGLSQRAMSEVVGLSQQRVQQILRGGHPAAGEASAG